MIVRCYPYLPFRFLLAVLLAAAGWAPDSSGMDEPHTLALLVQTIAETDDTKIRSALIDGMLRGLEGRRNVGPPVGWAALHRELTESELADAANRLSQIFGDPEANRRARNVLANEGASTEDRLSALRSLVNQQDDLLAQQLPGLLEIPELQNEAIRAYSVIASDDAARRLLQLFPRLSDQGQRVVVETLATRKAYAVALVAGIQSGVVGRDQIPSYIARSLRDLLGETFTKVYGDIPELQQNTSEMIAKYKRILSPEMLAKADPGRGRTVFTKTCGACHLMYGAGGQIGPDLTGSNRANLDYLLLNSVDPSADVPEGYRTLLIQTVDGRVLTGVLAAEDSQRVILKTVDQPRLVIAQSDIEARKVSDKSMMPEGQLDQLSREDLANLVKYMQTKTQVEAAK
ncbi:c-type cytochrome [Stieleria sp. TO1_6]|uniref:c-type cytochrome n=1 Tax=Stieleria tagensis TaxID=2956795 RepID=UPI00209B0659|nr:c-type cytochrome [Stieleria tagensis]MCO8125091.1 c-type cytochrome [Stieleria tagensis]